MKKTIAIIITVLVLVAAVTGVGFYMYSNRFIYNKEGDVGNTTGNLYNDGMFCAYKGFVYFANPNDNGRLYRMKEDGSAAERLCSDSVSCINICNDYIYYIRDNMAGHISFVSVDLSNGVSRLKIGKKEGESLHHGVSDSLLLCGNDLYYRAYNKKTGGYSVKKTGIDGKTTDSLFDESYLLLDYSDGKIYFANDGSNHNLMYYSLKDEKKSECFAGNFYMPDCEGDYLYYIDLDNGHKLSRLNIFTSKTEVLNEDYTVIYNLNAKTGEIYYQAENGKEDHRLCRMKTDGSGAETVLEGDYTDINYTEDYVYFYQIKGRNSFQLYRKPLSGGTPEVFDAPVDNRE